MSTPPGWIDRIIEGDDSDLEPPTNPSPKTKGKGLYNNDPEGWYIKKFPVVVAAKEWHVDRAVHKMIMKKKRHSMIRIEIRRTTDQGLGIHGYRDLEDGSEVTDWSDFVREGDVIVFNILKLDFNPENPKSSGNSGISHVGSTSSTSTPRPTSPSTVSTIGFKAVDEFSSLNPLHDINNWKVKHSTSISNVGIKRDKHKCVVTLDGRYDASESVSNVEFKFFSEQEAKFCLEFFQKLKRLHIRIAKNSMRKAIDLNSVSSIHHVKFLVEIISATDLKPVNRHSSDPYVVVKYGGEQVHQTAVIKKNLNPIWTIQTKSLFIFTLYPEEYYTCELMFEVRDQETFVNGSILGQALLSNRKLMKNNGERIELKLEYLQLDEKAQGYLAIRCRRATENDVDFLDRANRKKLSVKKNQSELITPLYSKQNPKQKFDMEKKIDGKKHHFVRPMGPQDAPQWLTSEEIDTTSKQESQVWTEAGNGELGVMYVEIISCDDLPNVDGGLARNKTDAFASLVFEESVLTTEVVRDCLSPRFMPWTRRAFKLKIQNTRSPLFIGVFDHDKITRHDPIGRIMIPLHQFAPGTTYDLTYDLHDSDQVVKRRKRGKINIRLKVQWSGQRKLFIDALRPHDGFMVNMDSKENYAHASYTVRGYVDLKEYNLKTVLEYGYELAQLQSVFFVVKDGLKSLFLWRGNYQLNICNCIKVWLPINSIVMFSFAVVLVEFPQYMMSVFFATIAWFMLALLGHRRNRPSVWERPPKYIHLLLRFLTGNCRPENIFSHQNDNEILHFTSKVTALEEKNKLMTEQFWNNLKEDLFELDTEKDKVLYRESMQKPMKIQLFKKILYPVQQVLAEIVYFTRLLSGIFSWSQMYLSFWITTFAILLAIASAAIVYTGYDCVFLWAKRLFVYIFLGPLVKIVDVCYFQKLERLSGKEQKIMHAKRERAKRNLFRKEHIATQVKMEDFLKTAALKEHMFGSHVLEVPDVRRPERYPSIPSFESSAFPNDNNPERSFKEANKQTFLRAQSVCGAFIPADFSEHKASNEIFKGPADENTSLGGSDELKDYGSLPY